MTKGGNSIFPARQPFEHCILKNKIKNTEDLFIVLILSLKSMHFDKHRMATTQN
jgi:hypothetical protein